jgi:uncharacterized protein (TIGR00730 family)
MKSLSKRLKEFAHFCKKMLGVNWRLLTGMWKLSKLSQPCVTFFGGARLTLDHPYAQKASELSRRLADAGYSVLTGGGPGIMEAANFGAYEHNKECKDNPSAPFCTVRSVGSYGIGLTRLNHESSNAYLQEYIIMEHFFERKWLLVRYSMGFAIFPGGFGTLDELFETITLIQTNRMPNTPVVLFGKEYWSPIKDWIYTRAIRDKLLSESDAALIHFVDDIDEAFEIITNCCERCEHGNSMGEGGRRGK